MLSLIAVTHNVLMYLNILKHSQCLNLSMNLTISRLEQIHHLFRKDRTLIFIITCTWKTNEIYCIFLCEFLVIKQLEKVHKDYSTSHVHILCIQDIELPWLLLANMTNVLCHCFQNDLCTFIEHAIEIIFVQILKNMNLLRSYINILD